MNYSIKQTLLLLFLFLSGPTIISAQYYCETVRPEDQVQVREKVMDCFSRATNITEEHLATFLSGGGDQFYNADIPVPSITISAFIQSEMRLTWEEIPEADMYQVRILNLHTLEEQSFWPKDSNLSIPIEGEQLYLSLISTIIWSGVEMKKSADFIIIDELPVIRDVLEYDCRCSNSRNLRNGAITPLALEEQMELMIYPNPSNGAIALTYTLASTQEVSIWLTDALGEIREVVQSAEQKNEGTHQLNVQLEHLASGWYHCLIKTENTVQQQAFLISH